MKYDPKVAQTASLAFGGLLILNAIGCGGAGVALESDAEFDAQSAPENGLCEMCEGVFNGCRAVKARCGRALETAAKPLRYAATGAACGAVGGGAVSFLGWVTSGESDGDNDDVLTSAAFYYAPPAIGAAFGAVGGLVAWYRGDAPAAKAASVTDATGTGTELPAPATPPPSSATLEPSDSEDDSGCLSRRSPASNDTIISMPVASDSEDK